jgi:hypothetical protein
MQQATEIPKLFRRSREEGSLTWRLTERRGRTNWRMRSDPREGAVRVGIGSVEDLGEAGG